MAFQQALSGLNSSSKAIDVISNNIANGSTVGFKASEVHFGDMYAASIQGTGVHDLGLGVASLDVAQQFSQGGIKNTNNPLDMSLNGQGFFRMTQNETTTYTRNGQFHTDKQGFIVNDNQLKLTGYMADASGVIVPAAPVPLQIVTTDLPPVATGSSIGSLGFSGVRGAVNLDSRSELPTGVWETPVGAAQVDPLSFNFSTAVSVFDALGNPHTLSMYFVKQDPAALDNVPASSNIKGVWDLHLTLDNTSEANIDILPAPTSLPASGEGYRLYFDGFGKLAIDPATDLPFSPAFGVSINLDDVATDKSSVNSANSPLGDLLSPTGAPLLGFKVDLEAMTQYGSAFARNSMEQDGFTSGRLADLNVGVDGVIEGRYSNGQTRSLGQVVLANFTSPNGLQPLGNNQWAETSGSGAPAVGAPGTSSFGVIQSSSVEESNVDLTQELVNMITAQRNYQANAQSIKTQDQIMNTLLNLR